MALHTRLAAAYESGHGGKAKGHGDAYQTGAEPTDGHQEQKRDPQSAESDASGERFRRFPPLGVLRARRANGKAPHGCCLRTGETVDVLPLSRGILG